MWEDYKTAEDRLNQANTNDWYIIPLVIIVGLCIAIPVTMRIHNVDKMFTKDGDMNHDGQLTIVDLSILAEVIRTNP
jgi:hypothetical protein